MFSILFLSFVKLSIIFNKIIIKNSKNLEKGKILKMHLYDGEPKIAQRNLFWIIFIFNILIGTF